MDWDNFRIFSVLAKTGSVRGAAEQLGVNPSTVTRRLEQMEQQLGVHLFTRSQQGLRITAEGAAAVERVEKVAAAINDIQHSLMGLDQRLEGRIRVAMPDVLANQFLVADLAAFTAAYPSIDLEILPSYQDLDLRLGDVDVAIRATENPPQSMVGRPLLKVALAAYASETFVLKHAPDETTIRVPWVDWAGPGEIMDLYSNLRSRYFPDVHVHVRCGQIQMHLAAVKAHMGIGILPCFLADHEPGLVRLPQMPRQQGPTLWLLSHADLRSAQRVQVFLQHVRGIFEARQSMLTGTGLTGTD